MMRRIVFWMSLLCVATPVDAQDESGPKTVETLVQQARAAIEDADFENARMLLDEAESLAPESAIPVTKEGLRNIAFYRGVLDHYLGEGVATGQATDTTMDFFRQALVHDLNFEWDRNLVADPEGGVEYLFAQLKDEVASRNQSETRIPEQSAVRVLVDGIVVAADDFVIHGRHLVQVMCPDTRVLGRWIEFGESPDFGCFCGEDTCFTQKVVKEGPQWSLFALGGGGALLAGGAITHFGVAAPTYAEIQAKNEDPHNINRKEADALTARWNVQRTVALSLYISGALMAGAGGGMFALESVSLHPTATGLGLSGQF